jgi:hypothetical protein
MTFLDICQLLKRWNGMYERMKHGAPSPLIVTDDVSNPILRAPVEPETTTNIPPLEKSCDDLGLDIGFDMETFNSDQWPIDNFSFFASV